MQQIEAAYEGRVDMVQTVIKAVFGEPKQDGRVETSAKEPGAVKNVMRGLMSRRRA